MDLFDSAAEDRLRAVAPLAERVRPRDLAELAGQEHLLAPGAPLRLAIEGDRLGSALFVGPPGTGKTTVARLVAALTDAFFEELSAVNAGKAEVQAVVGRARERLGANGRRTILFLDEIHRFNKAQQDALLPVVESGLVTLIGATTENPYHSVIGALLSRLRIWRFEQLDEAALLAVVERGATALGAPSPTPEALEDVVRRAAGDARGALQTLELAHADARARGAEAIDLDDVERAADRRPVTYDRAGDRHYDTISAFIKSVRGSDVDAALYYLASMIEGGEDARFIARRIVILASEDIGNADPAALPLAVAAGQAVELVGLPEARYALAQVTAYLALAPKSNASALAASRSIEAVRAAGSRVPPPPLRDASYRGAKALGHGVGYRYPHDDPRGWTEQRHLPEGVDVRLYEPTRHGHEAELRERVERLRRGEAPW